MFEVGFQELLMIALLALIVLGPEKLPKLAAKVGHWTGRARAMARNLRTQLEQEVSYDELKQQKEAAEAALRRAQEAPMDFHADITADETPATTSETAPVSNPTADPEPTLLPQQGAAPATDSPPEKTLQGIGHS
jgi:sec-independent protein translocase protein TatB